MGARENFVRLVDSHPIRMFPTLVWRTELADDLRASINASILKVLANLRRFFPPLRYGEGWQSKHDLQDEALFVDFIACVRAAATEVLDFTKIPQPDVAVTGCWLNVIAPGRAHRVHSHPNNFLSGVYYLKTQAGADTVNFHDPRPQTRIIRPPATALTADNTDQVVVKVMDGTLLLFPAWLEHSVDENRSVEERISVSFNLMFSGYSETMSAPLW